MTKKKDTRILTASGLTLSMEQCWVYANSYKARKVQLGPQEALVLAYLMEHGVGRPVGLEEMAMHVPAKWSDSLLRMHVMNIRTALRKITRRDVILTVQDRGYMLEVMR